MIPRPVRITVVSDAALYYKAGDYQKAQEIAEKWVNGGAVPSFAAVQLENMLQTLKDGSKRKDAGRKINKSLDQVGTDDEPDSNGSARSDDTNYYKLHSLMSQLIAKENKLLDELQRESF